MFEVYFTNFRTNHTGFQTVEDAFNFILGKGFMASIFQDNELILSWNPISGTTYRRDW